MITFAGKDWLVKDSGYLPEGAGGNVWSKDNVYVDWLGKLHLQVKWNSLYHVWECAQVVCANSLGYGTYRWYVEGFHSRMDENLVLGLYTYDPEAKDDHYREIDIEHSQWGVAYQQNSQYVLTPAKGTYPKERFMTVQDGSYTAHEFTWEPDRVTFQSWKGHRVDREPYFSWSCEEGVPTPGNETARMNLWLFKGQPPHNGQDAEIIIKDFDFIPFV